MRWLRDRIRRRRGGLTDQSGVPVYPEDWVRPVVKVEEFKR